MSFGHLYTPVLCGEVRIHKGDKKMDALLGSTILDHEERVILHVTGIVTPFGKCASLTQQLTQVRSAEEKCWKTATAFASEKGALMLQFQKPGQCQKHTFVFEPTPDGGYVYVKNTKLSIPVGIESNLLIRGMIEQYRGNFAPTTEIKKRTAATV